MKFHTAFAASFLFLCLAAPAAAQTDKRGAKERKVERERAIKRCKENRGVDCESAEGLKEWLGKERPITDAERQAAAGARRHREMCAKTKNAAGC